MAAVLKAILSSTVKGRVCRITKLNCVFLVNARHNVMRYQEAVLIFNESLRSLQEAYKHCRPCNPDLHVCNVNVMAPLDQPPFIHLERFF